MKSAAHLIPFLLASTLPASAVVLDVRTTAPAQIRSVAFNACMPYRQCGSTERPGRVPTTKPFVYSPITLDIRVDQPATLALTWSGHVQCFGQAIKVGRTTMSFQLHAALSFKGPPFKIDLQEVPWTLAGQQNQAESGSTQMWISPVTLIREIPISATGIYTFALVGEIYFQAVYNARCIFNGGDITARVFD